MSQRKFSIITINYNNKEGLRKTIESVVGQSFRDFEYIIIDGGSTDGSIEVIKEYAGKVDYWVTWQKMVIQILLMTIREVDI